MLFANLFIVFVLGTIVGSFLNVVIFRYNTGFSIITGRSKCFSCGKSLYWYELLPLFSFLMLGGKCLDCNSKISNQYFTIELLTGVIFSGLFLKFGLVPLLPLYLVIASILIVMSVYDFKHKIIPDGMVYTFIALSIITFVITHPQPEAGQPLAEIILAFLSSSDFLAAPILFVFFAFFWLVSDGKWMGFGDAKLAIGVGFLLGFSGGIYAIMMAFWIGAGVSILLILLQKLKLAKFKLSFKSEIPFAPFIILAVFIQLITSWNITSIINFFS